MVFLIDIRDMPNLSKHRIQQVSILFFYIQFGFIFRFFLSQEIINRKKLATLIPYCHYVFNLSRVSYSILPNNVLV